MGVLIEVGGERFRVDKRTQDDGTVVLDFTWLNGPSDPLYGFTIGRSYGFPHGRTPATDVPPVDADPTLEELEHDVGAFVRAFFSDGGIGPSDFPDFVASRRASA